ncbi:Six-hairpin glycosidase [Aspergillus karnatakaensis]|uniref:Six-hairpin glycosidase n=1 Tax=Aspergillus karnatakaensis TaxID=1810916 RepID=UPI003CCE4019
MGESMATWIWHPEWSEETNVASAGTFVHFRKTVILPDSLPPSQPVVIHITADTRYKLYINSRLVSVGPVKGDQHLWFYDELDIRPYLHLGENTINVRVLRLYYATPHATSFPRLNRPGLLIRHLESDTLSSCFQSDGTWETAIDRTTRLPTDDPEDDFLHIYERANGIYYLASPEWVPAKKLLFPSSHGLSAPWKLSPRVIPPSRYEPAKLKSICSLQSTLPQTEWKKVLLGVGPEDDSLTIRLPAGSRHYLEIEAEAHITCFPCFRFEWPQHGKSVLRVTYSECYEDTPYYVPYVRRKGDRCDTTKKILGPHDEYIFGGITARRSRHELLYHEKQADEEVFAPFHMRTFRFLALNIEVSEEADLVLKRIDLTKTNYPLKVLASIRVPSADNIYQDMWTTSVRTLTNCMHDCYEDCPFYEQLQYAMDARSSALFTYCISGDDRLSRQAINQLHNSYSPRLGLTESRAPAHQPQIIPHFSLFWICMITDHFHHFNNSDFSRQFLPAADGVLETFARRINPDIGLIRSRQNPDQWDFVDWAEPWKPMGIPPAAERTGYQSYTNMLYAYTLQALCPLLTATGRPSLAQEYQSRAENINKALLTHCFDSQFFTDGLAATALPETDYSQNSQVWAVLCGAAKGHLACQIMTECTAPPNTLPSSARKINFTKASTAMSFYTLRALSLASAGLYNTRFHTFWDPWRSQLAQNLTTWVEDSVSNRSDCHAWGSSLLHEALVEVAGVRNEGDVIVFRPRVSLFERFEAKVPVVRDGGICLLGVRWEPKEGGESDICVSLSLESGPDQGVVRAEFPNGRVESLDGGAGGEVTVTLAKGYLDS